ncbi:hypothetical protein HJG60_009190 [Phyllostomus discolor]|uniref:Uncharacterized protein n=1 Tax=Phyllostomus discolor TaxID=89673 RepID=A0A833YJZ2_9CHIR|nr:hypothetical protein HJG60_009190 [Phyllostomus discolor]
METRSHGRAREDSPGPGHQPLGALASGASWGAGETQQERARLCKPRAASGASAPLTPHPPPAGAVPAPPTAQPETPNFRGMHSRRDNTLLYDAGREWTRRPPSVSRDVQRMPTRARRGGSGATCHRGLTTSQERLPPEPQPGGTLLAGVRCICRAGTRTQRLPAIVANTPRWVESMQQPR